MSDKRQFDKLQIPMKNSLFALAACTLCASVAIAAPNSKTPTKSALTKATAKPIVAKAVAKVAPTKIAQTDSAAKPAAAPGFFPDVPRDHWAFAAVQRLATAGIVEGYPAAPGAKAPVVAANSNETKVAEKADAAPDRVAAMPADAKVAQAATPTGDAK